MRYTGLSDVYRMTWADIVGDTIRVARSKTAAKLTIPIHDALHRELAVANRDHRTILVTGLRRAVLWKELRKHDFDGDLGGRLA